jgi:hypothetical protein
MPQEVIMPQELDIFQVDAIKEAQDSALNELNELSKEKKRMSPKEVIAKLSIIFRRYHNIYTRGHTIATSLEAKYRSMSGLITNEMNIRHREVTRKASEFRDSRLNLADEIKHMKDVFRTINKGKELVYEIDPRITEFRPDYHDTTQTRLPSESDKISSANKETWEVNDFVDSPYATSANVSDCNDLRNAFGER